MKKLSFTSAILVILFIVMGSMNAFQKIERISFESKAVNNLPIDGEATIKYNDCITEIDSPDELHGHARKLHDQYLDSSLSKIDVCVKKFGKSMDSTLKNLSTVDAHEYIHQSFEKSKNTIAGNNISDIQKYYHLEIMRICYERDKSLNHNSVGRL